LKTLKALGVWFSTLKELPNCTLENKEIYRGHATDNFFVFGVYV
jgi:hypothetical protein